MYSLLLAIIYLAFISLGLPDSLLGSAWPIMQRELNAPVSYAGVIVTLIVTFTIVSTLFSNRITSKLGAGLVTAISTLLTAIGLLGFSYSRSYWMLCLFTVPYGLGAGAVDAALNNYVALHFTPKHMNWLHCSWGVGATISPYIMGYCLTNGMGWRSGYFSVFVIQIILTALLFFSLPLWKKDAPAEEEEKAPPISIKQALSIRGVKYVLLIFFFYIALENTAGLWASSYLVQKRGIEAQTAAAYASMYYLGITGGRFLMGFVADKVPEKLQVRLSIAVATAGILLVMIPFSQSAFALCGLVILGLGCAPIFPAIIHSTPSQFGKHNSQTIIGLEMAGAYTGATVTPPLFGLIAQEVDIGLYPAFLLLFTALMFVLYEMMNKAIKARKE